MTLTTHRSPPLSTQAPLPPPQRLAIDMYLAFALMLNYARVCLSVPTACEFVMQKHDYLVQCPHNLIKY